MKRSQSFLPLGLLALAACLATMLAGSAQAGLVGYWNFDEGTGTSLADSSGNGNTATAVSTLTFDTDVPASIGSGFSLSLDGSTGSADAPDSASLSVTGDLTLSAWVKPVQATGAPGYILSKNVAAYRWRVETSNPGNGNSNQRAWVAGADNGNFFMPYDSGNWKHVAMAVDFSAGTVSIYLNGNPLGTNSFVPTSIPDLSHALNIGADITSEVFNGLLDDVAIFDEVLDSAQVASLADGSRTPLTVAIPEPSSLLLLGLGFAGMLVMSRRK